MFHGSFDFGYLFKAVTGLLLPETAEEFFSKLKLYFPMIYDIKYITKDVEDLNGGLTRMSRYIGVERIGAEH